MDPILQFILAVPVALAATLSAIWTAVKLWQMLGEGNRYVAALLSGVVVFLFGSASLLVAVEIDEYRYLIIPGIYATAGGGYISGYVIGKKN